MKIKMRKMAKERYYPRAGRRTHVATVGNKDFEAFILDIKDQQDFECTFGLSNASKYNGQKQVLCIEAFNNEDLLENLAFAKFTLDDAIIFYLDARAVEVEA